MLEAFADAALLHAALAFEAALAGAEAATGTIPTAHADTIQGACRPDYFDIAALAQAAAHAGTLAIPLVARLRAIIAETDPDAALSVHLGATSQDVADTALMLQAKAGLALIDRDVARLRASLADLAQAYADTPMLGRTLLQGALPITFGAKIQIWLDGLNAAAFRLAREAETAVALQFGGACGTRAGLDGQGDAIAAHLALALGLHNPPRAWHAQRQGIAGLGTALAALAGALGKIARDISLLAQTEVGELHEPRVPGRGGSSAMAHKRNPTGCQVVLSAAARTPGLAATLLATLPAEHERGLGGWQAEGPVLADLFLLTHGAIAALIPVIAGLEVDTAAMQRHLTPP
jgi:3-carboxy-cis,cis-muconate cycloisomerase